MLAVQTALEEKAARQTLLKTLQRQVQQLEKPRRPASGETFSMGCAALDRLLPEGGWSRGTLVEWFTARPGAGVFTLALLSARTALGSGGLLVISDLVVPGRGTAASGLRMEFHAPAAAALGIDPEQIVVLRPTSAADELWAIDQALRCEGVAVVWAALSRLDDHDFRRLQLATEAGGTIGFLARPARARGQPAWSDLQLLVEPCAAAENRRLRVEVVRIRGGVAGASVMLEIDDLTGQVREATEHHETHPVPQISRLAPAATRRRQA